MSDRIGMAWLVDTTTNIELADFWLGDCAYGLWSRLSDCTTYTCTKVVPSTVSDDTTYDSYTRWFTVTISEFKQVLLEGLFVKEGVRDEKTAAEVTLLLDSLITEERVVVLFDYS